MSVSVANAGQEHKGRMPKGKEDPSTPAPKVVEPPKSGVACPVLQDCPSHQFSYYVQSGQGIDNGPVICYNNEM